MENIDFSDAISKVQEMLSGEDGQNQLQGILNMFMNQDTDSRTEQPDCKEASSGALSPSSFNPSDLDMLLKMKRILSAVNNQGTTASESFLISLKPLLKKERQAKLEQAIKVVSMAKVFKTFRDINEGGG